MESQDALQEKLLPKTPPRKSYSEAVGNHHPGSERNRTPKAAAGNSEQSSIYSSKRNEPQSIEDAQGQLIARGSQWFSSSYSVGDDVFLESERGPLQKPSELRKGSIFAAALPHPYHKALYERLYLIVGYTAAYDSKTVRYIITMFVVGLETNGGRGRHCYDDDYHRFVKSIKPFQDGHPSDNSSFYARGPDRTHWDPRETTVVDLTTVLMVRVNEGSKLLAKHVADLCKSSIEHIDRSYTALETLDEFGVLMDRRSPKKRPKAQKNCSCCYCKANQQCPLLPPTPQEKRAPLPQNTCGATSKIFRTNLAIQFWDTKTPQ